MIESMKCNEIRILHSTHHEADAWFNKAARHLGLHVAVLMAESSMLKRWQKQWGTVLHDEATGTYIWTDRPDFGPHLADTNDVPGNVKLIRFALMAILAEQLAKCGLLSYVTLGIPSDWRKAKVFLNDQEIEMVKWADALAGTVEVALKGKPTPEGELPTKLLRGSVRIELGQDGGFF